MKLSEFKTCLSKVKNINFSVENGAVVPKHFHITEVGLSSKHFIDCGGTIRTENKICMQLWIADDTEHRLLPKKLSDIIQLAEKELNLADLDIIVEYQTSTISTYGLKFEMDNFILTSTMTNCLAKDKCGIPPAKKKIILSDLTKTKANNCCNPEEKCC